MEPITEFHIMCYHDIYNEIVDINKQIMIPTAAPNPIRTFLRRKISNEKGFLEQKKIIAITGNKRNRI